MKNSHVIPKSFFTRLKRNGPAIQTSDDLLYRNRSTQDSWSQHMLCSDCEQKLSKWEEYSIDVLRRPKRRKVRVVKTAHTWEFFNVDYEIFRLFELSLIFRAAVSTRQEFVNYAFSDTQVKRMRYLLNSNEAPNENEFPCLIDAIWSPTNQDQLYTQVIGIPEPLLYDEKVHHWFVFGGFCWYFVFPELSDEQLGYHSFLHRGGYIKIPVMHLHEHPWLSFSVEKMELKNVAGHVI